jgi:hypothetical protein
MRARDRLVRDPVYMIFNFATSLDRRRSAPVTDPLSRGFGIPNRSPDPLVQRAGRDHPFPVFAGSPWRERDVARRMRHGDMTSQGEKLRGRTPPGPCGGPHDACGAQCPLPSRGDALFLEQGPGIVVVGGRPSCVLPNGVPQGKTECHTERGGIVLAVICWAPSAQRQCHQIGRCAYRPSVIY